MKKWLIYIGALALYTVGIYFLFRPEIKEAEQAKKQYFEERGFKTDTIRLAAEQLPPKLIPYPVQMPPETVTLYDTVKVDRPVYVPMEPGKPSIHLPNHYGKYPFLISGDFKDNLLTLTLEDTSGRIRTESYPTLYSDYNYRYTNNSMSTELKTTRDNPKSARNIPFIRYDKTYVEYKHDFLQQGRTVGISSGVTIKDRVRLTGFGELGINNAPDQAGIKVGFKLF